MQMNELETLFNEWRASKLHSGHLFITDGPIDLHKWEAAPTKILFLAKEAYDSNLRSGSWDLPSLIREDWQAPKHKIWWTAAYWALGLSETKSNSIAEYPGAHRNYKTTIEALLSAAIVNVKKSQGQPSSDTDNLKVYVRADGDRIKQQIELLEPDIIVGCYTWPLMSHLWPDAVEICDLVYKLPRGALVVDYWHPANRYPNSVMFYALCAIYQRALQAMGAEES